MKIESYGASSSGNAHLISDGETTLLLDAGLPFKKLQIAIGFRITAIDGVLLSHAHGDHSKSIKALISCGIDVYGSEDTFRALEIQSYRAHVVEPLMQFKVGSMIITPIEAEHDCPGTYGFIVRSNITNERLLYLTDSYYCKYDPKGLTHMIVECNYLDDLLDASDIDRVQKSRIRKSHMSLQTLEKMIANMDRSKLQKIYLTHLSDRHSDAAMFKDRIQRLTGVEVYIL